MKQRILKQTRIRGRREVEMPESSRGQNGAWQRPRTRASARPRRSVRVTSAVEADDALGMYLHEMGLTPLLTRDEELALVRHLEVVRRRYRRVLLWDWSVVARCVTAFAVLKANRQAFERSLDVFPGLGLTPQRIRARLPGVLRALDDLLREKDRLNASAARATRSATLARLKRQGHGLLRRAIGLVEKLSPRTELVEEWAAAAPREPWLARALRARAEAYHRARRELAQANLRLVVSIAKKYRGRGLSFGDMIQEGNAGLMRAVDKFDHRLGYKFGTYATWWIRQGITRSLADHGRTVRVPSHHVTTLTAIERARAELAVARGAEPSDEEVAASLGMAPGDLRALAAAGRAPVSLDEAFSGDDEHAFVEFLGDGGVSPGESADQALLKERVAEVLRCLPQRDRDVLELRFGLRDGRSRTLDEVAGVLGVTRERVRQIEVRGLLKLRQPEWRTRLAGFAEVA